MPCNAQFKELHTSNGFPGFLSPDCQRQLYGEALKRIAAKSIHNVKEQDKDETCYIRKE